VDIIGVVANTTPLGPYRGAGRPEAAYFTERLVDLVAAETGLDPAEVRKRNFIKPEQFPYQTCTGLTYDSGDYQAALDKLLDNLGYASLRKEQEKARQEGRLLGIGMASFVEPGGVTPNVPSWPKDSATVTVEPSGKVTIGVGTSSHGQGHETAYAQIAADILGVPFDAITVLNGDTATSPFGYGTFGSRSAVVGGSAVVHACQAVLDKAHQVDAPLPLAEVAARMAATGGLQATATADVSGITYASGSYGCVVEIDPDTGKVSLLRIIAVDDCGSVINPLIVGGQVHGAVAQGVGQALYEHVQYDEEGQPMSASLMDYAVPFAAQLPMIESDHVETPSPINPLGVKGMGESGTIGVTPALVNAVMDALRPLGIRHLDMPLTPEKVWTAIQAAASPRPS
jgi:carbon-monoxide dehydrogenase large subunit